MMKPDRSLDRWRDDLVGQLGKSTAAIPQPTSKSDFTDDVGPKLQIVGAEIVGELQRQLASWSRVVTQAIGAERVYVFGSLVYRQGTQFGAESDVDLIVPIPQILFGALARQRWLGQLLERKIELERELATSLKRNDQNKVICSVIAATSIEIAADIHKDGSVGFFKNNLFLDLQSLTVQEGLHVEGDQPLSNRLVIECLRFAQKKRNAFLAVAASGKTTIEPYAQADPIPKDLMRHAAMAHRLGKPHAPTGAEYDTQFGLDFLSHSLYELRGQDSSYDELYNWLSIRRGARGKVGPLSPSQHLLFVEIIYDYAMAAMQRQDAIATAAPPPPASANRDFDLGQNEAQSAQDKGPIRWLRRPESSAVGKAGVREGAVGNSCLTDGADLVLPAALAVGNTNRGATPGVDLWTPGFSQAQIAEVYAPQIAE